MCIIVFSIRFEEKGPKTANFGQCRGSFAAAKRPLIAEKDPHTTTRPRRRIFPSSGSLRRSEATIHNMEMLCFCFALFFRCSEDLSIGLIMIL